MTLKAGKAEVLYKLVERLDYRKILKGYKHQMSELNGIRSTLIEVENSDLNHHELSGIDKSLL